MGCQELAVSLGCTVEHCLSKGKGKEEKQETCMIFHQPGMVGHTFNPSTKEEEADTSLSSRPAKTISENQKKSHNQVIWGNLKED